MSLQSHGSLIAGETEAKCAERWRAHYGIARGFTLAHVMRATHPSPPMRVYYRTVEALLGAFEEPRSKQPKEPQGARRLKPDPAIIIIDRQIREQIKALRASRVSRPRPAPQPRSQRRGK